jgi:hypothetical protein
LRGKKLVRVPLPLALLTDNGLKVTELLYIYVRIFYRYLVINRVDLNNVKLNPGDYEMSSNLLSYL